MSQSPSTSVDFLGVSSEVPQLLGKCDSDFRSGDKVQYSAKRAEQKRDTKPAKGAHKNIIEDQITQ